MQDLQNAGKHWLELIIALAIQRTFAFEVQMRLLEIEMLSG